MADRKQESCDPDHPTEMMQNNVQIFSVKRSRQMMRYSAAVPGGDSPSVKD